mmetsp:Transcript_6694/g.14635  ORF Transcript_6694/g.14635 Transcript_6694/m.14635 type:complete len:372 (-) Transcript_6694:523-1638(-)
MFQQNNRGAGATRRKFGTSIDVNSARNDDGAAAKGGKAGAPVEKRTTRSMVAGGEAFARAPTSRSNGNQMRDDVSSRPQGSSRTSVRSSTFTVPNASSYQHTGQVDNIDDRDREDPLCATDYVQEMYTHFRGKEDSTSVRPTYMENQSHINERMRAILVDWLVEVHLKFKLVPETLYLTVNLIDRYLERKEVERPKLQLVGVTCLLIASKYEEIYPPELRDLVYVCDRAYSGNEIIDMEERVLKALEYQITIPSAHAFLVRYLKAAHADKKIVQLACFVLDGTLQSYNLLHYLPSQLAAAAVFIARRSVGRNSWSPTLLKYAEYCEEEVIPVARSVLAEKNSTSPELRAVTKKYTSNRYGGVANTPLQCDF